jgi:iron complex outermembrane receptor protein
MSLPPASALAQDAIDLGTVQAVGNANEGDGGFTAPARPNDPNSAPYQAPTKTPLTVTQPTSVISQQYIQNNVPKSANFDQVIKISPSVATTTPNGPGLSDGRGTTMRGFADGQYNVTFDGIPFGDSTNFAHDTAAWFMTNDLGQISVDRGPGTASTIGDATFGGTISLVSKAPLPNLTVTPYGSYGSWNTSLAGMEGDTGSIRSLSGASAFIDVERLNSDGYLTNTPQSRTNVFSKVVQPLGSSSVLTMVTMYDSLNQHVPLGATRQQIAMFGPNFQLSNNSRQQNYEAYNYDKLQNDFEYIGLTSDLGDGFSLDNKIYTYGYDRHSAQGLDVNGNTPNGTFYSPDNVPGTMSENGYRAYGDVTRLQKDTSFGDIKAGFWYEHQRNSRNDANIDLTLGEGYFNPPTSKGVVYAVHDTLDSIQPYVEVDWHVAPRLTVTPGLKYDIFMRGLDAPVNQSTRIPQKAQQTWEQPLPPP